MMKTSREQGRKYSLPSIFLYQRSQGRIPPKFQFFRVMPFHGRVGYLYTMVFPFLLWISQKVSLELSYLPLSVLTSVSAPTPAFLPLYTFLPLDRVATMKEKKRIAAGTS